MIVALAHDPSAGNQSTLERDGWPFRLHRISEPHASLLTVRNSAVAQAQGKILIFLDGAVGPDPALVEKHFAAHELGDRLVVLGNVRVRPDSPFGSVAEAIAFESIVRARCSVSGYHPLVSDFYENNFSTRRSDFVSSGGWDETCSSGGRIHQLEMGWRLRQAGLRFQFDPDASGARYYDQRLSWFLSDLQQLGRDQIRFFRRHPAALRELRFPLIITGTWLKRAAFRLSGMMPRAAFTTLSKLAASFYGRQSPAGLNDSGWLLLKSIAGLFLTRGFWDEADDISTVIKQLRLCVPILSYPFVGTSPDAQEVISAEDFSRQMDWLAEWGYQTVSLTDFCNWRDSLKPLPSKPVVLTFSGESHGILKTVLPVLENHRFHGTAFLQAERLSAETSSDPQSGPATKREIQSLAEKGTEVGVSLSVAGRDMRTAEKAFQDQISRAAGALGEFNPGGARFFSCRADRWAFLLPDMAESFGFKAGCADNSGLNRYDTHPIFLKAIRAAGETRKARFRDLLQQRHQPAGTLEKWSSFYSRTTRAGWIVETADFYRLLAAELRALMKGEQFRNVLEVGCGNGALYPFLELGEVFYKGIDISPAMLGAFKRKCPQVELECCDASTYSDPDRRYDLIFSNGLIQHFDRDMINKHFASVRPMMHPGSLFICAAVPWKSQRSDFYAGTLTEPWNRSIATRAKWWIKIAAYGDGMGRWFELREFYDLAARYGFSVKFYGSLTYLYAFHAVMRLAEMKGER